MKKILVVNVNWLGDVIFSSPVFRALKENYPNAEIFCLAVSRVCDIARRIPWVDHVIELEEHGKHRGFWGTVRLIRQLRQHQFDVAFLLHRSITRGLIVFFSGIKIRVGYVEKNRSKYLTHIVDPKPEVVHRSDYYLNVIESFGIKVSDRSNSLLIDSASQLDVEKTLKDKGYQADQKMIVINPGGNWSLKRWPIKNFARLTEKLLELQKYNVVISGSKEDVSLVDEMTKDLKQQPIVLTGQTTLGQAIALMRKADLLVSSDSGPLHLANAVGTDVIGIFGPTRPEITGPRGSGRCQILQYDVGCNKKACYYLQCPDNICMQAVSVSDVLYAIEQN